MPNTHIKEADNSMLNIPIVQSLRNSNIILESASTSTDFPFVEITLNQFISSTVAQLTDAQWAEITNENKNTNIIIIKSHALNPAHTFPAIRSDMNKYAYYSLYIQPDINGALIGTYYYLNSTNKTITFAVKVFGEEITEQITNNSSNYKVPTESAVSNFVHKKVCAVQVYVSSSSYSTPDSCSYIWNQITESKIAECALLESAGAGQGFNIIGHLKLHSKTSDTILFTETYINNSDNVVVNQLKLTYTSEMLPPNITMTTKTLS